MDELTVVFRNLPGAARLLPALLMCFHGCSICVGAEASHTNRTDPAHGILADTSVPGGLIVHLGHDFGRGAAALRRR